MPVFDYQCNDCGRQYDVYHKSREIKEDNICPDCGSNGYKKLMSAPMVAVGQKSRQGLPPSGGGCSGGLCGLN